MTEGVDTSIYNNLTNPSTQVNNTLNNAGAMQNLMVQGIQLHANQSVGNAVMNNTGPDGTVNTNGMMAELAGSGNPFAQQQGAELAQKISLEQSINQQEKIKTEQAHSGQISNELLGFYNQGDFSQKAIDSFIAPHYLAARSDDSYMGDAITPMSLMDFRQTLLNAPEEQRAQMVKNSLNTFMLRSGNLNAFTPSVQTMTSTGAQATEAPLTAVEKGLPTPSTPSAGAMSAPSQSPSPSPSGTNGTFVTNKGLSNSQADQLNATISQAQNSEKQPNNTPARAPVPAPSANPDAGLNVTGLTPEEQQRRQQQTTTNVSNSNQITTDANSAKMSLNAALAAKKIFADNPNASGLVTSVLMHSPMGAQFLSDNTLSDAQRGQKLLQQVANASGVAGGGLTNAGQEVVNAANPSITNVNKAIEENLDRIIGMQQRAVAKGNMWRNYTQQNGLSNATAKEAEFEQNFANVADPQIFQTMSMSKPDRVKYLQSLSPAEHQQFVSRYNALKQQGAFDEQP